MSNWIVARRNPVKRPRPCYYCGKPGHFWMRCRALLEKLKAGGFAGRLDGGNRSYGNSPQRGPVATTGPTIQSMVPRASRADRARKYPKETSPALEIAHRAWSRETEPGRSGDRHYVPTQ